MDDNRVMLRAARVLCDSKPPTKVAVNWIRQKRRCAASGKSAPDASGHVTSPAQIVNLTRAD
jgi:hypothetical protein